MGRVTERDATHFVYRYSGRCIKHLTVRERAQPDEVVTAFIKVFGGELVGPLEMNKARESVYFRVNRNGRVHLLHARRPFGMTWPRRSPRKKAA